MHQYVESVAIQHQPRDNLREFFWLKFHLVHRLWMRAYRRVAPSAHLHFEHALDRFADARSGVARRLIVVDVRVIAIYYRWIDRIRHPITHSIMCVPERSPGSDASCSSDIR